MIPSPRSGDVAVTKVHSTEAVMTAGDAGVINSDTVKALEKLAKGDPLMGANMALTGLTTALSIFADGNNKVVQTMMAVNTGLSVLITLQQASQMLGGAAGIKGMLQNLLPSLTGFMPAMLGAVVPFLPLLLPVLLGGGVFAAVSHFNDKERKRIEDQVKLKPAQVTTNEYLRVSSDVGRSLFSDIAKPSSKDPQEVANQERLINAVERTAAYTGGTYRTGRNAGVLNSQMTTAYGVA
jgi:hypothetical protein